MTDNIADTLAALRKREQELSHAFLDLQGRLHEIRNVIAALERAAMLSVERATGQRPATGRPRKPVQVIGLPVERGSKWPDRTGIDANGEPDPDSAA